jgi:hypothetical protein
LQYCPLTFEFEIVSSATEVLISPTLTANIAEETKTDAADPNGFTGFTYMEVLK